MCFRRERTEFRFSAIKNQEASIFRSNHEKPHNLQGIHRCPQDFAVIFGFLQGIIDFAHEPKQTGSSLTRIDRTDRQRLADTMWRLLFFAENRRETG